MRGRGRLSSRNPLVFAQYLLTETIQPGLEYHGCFFRFSVANLFCTHFPICHQDLRIAHLLHKWSHYPNHKPIYSTSSSKFPPSLPVSSPDTSLRIDVRGMEHNMAITSLWGMLQEITNNC